MNSTRIVYAYVYCVRIRIVLYTLYQSPESITVQKGQEI